MSYIKPTFIVPMPGNSPMACDACVWGRPKYKHAEWCQWHGRAWSKAIHDWQKQEPQGFAEAYDVKTIIE